MIVSSERRAALTAKAELYASHLDDAMPYLMSRCISREAAEMFGLGFVPAGEPHAGRVSIPFHTPSGVVQIKLRCANVEHGDHKGVRCPKYIPVESGLGIRLYNAQSLIKADEIAVITEGEFDCLCIQAYCGIPAVAYPGVDSWQAQRHFRHCFEGISQVVVVADGDDVGRKAARHVAESIGMAARVCELPDGYDSNSYLMERGVASLLERIAA